MKSSHKTVSTRCAFTLVELLVVITILTLLAVLLLPAFQRVQELARRAKCKVNVKGIAEACAIYMSEPGMHYNSGIGYGLPRGKDPSDISSGATTPKAPKPGDWATANPASLWLLVRYKFVGRDSFLCPSAGVYRTDGNFIAPEADDDSFTESDRRGDTLSYSYLSQVEFKDDNPGVADNGLVKITGSVSPGLKASELAIIADENPACRVGKQSFDSEVDAMRNSFNHRSAYDVNDMGGQNVAFMDGHAAWFSSPIIPGTRPLTTSADEDNIYRSCKGATVRMAKARVARSTTHFSFHEFRKFL